MGARPAGRLQRFVEDIARDMGGARGMADLRAAPSPTLRANCPQCLDRRSL